VDRLEFAKIMAYLGIATGKPLSEEAHEVYYDLLGDLPAPTLQAAARRVLLEHRWATFPSIAELRQAASETIRGQVSELSPAEAWEKAWRAVARIDLEMPHTLDAAFAGLPPTVAEAMRAFGLPSLVSSKSPVEVVRAQFVKIYEQLAARDRRVALVPAALKRDVAEIGAARVALPVARIGQMPGDERN
jgi:hypothetical protein